VQILHKATKTTTPFTKRIQMLPIGQILTIAIAVGTVIKETLDDD